METPNTMEFSDILDEYLENKLRDEGDSIEKWREINFRQLVLRYEMDRRNPSD